MYLTPFCPPPALILRILLPPLLYTVVPAGKIIRVCLQPPPLTVLLSLCLAIFVFTGLLLCSGPLVWFEILAAIRASPPLLFCIVHSLSYENYGWPCGRERSDHTTVVLREQQFKWGQTGYPSRGTSNYRLHSIPRYYAPHFFSSSLTTRSSFSFSHALILSLESLADR